MALTQPVYNQSYEYETFADSLGTALTKATANLNASLGKLKESPDDVAALADAVEKN